MAQLLNHYTNPTGPTSNRSEIFVNSGCQEMVLKIMSPIQCFDAVGWAAGKASGP